MIADLPTWNGFFDRHSFEFAGMFCLIQERTPYRIATKRAPRSTLPDDSSVQQPYFISFQPNSIAVNLRSRREKPPVRITRPFGLYAREILANEVPPSVLYSSTTIACICLPRRPPHLTWAPEDEIFSSI